MSEITLYRPGLPTPPARMRGRPVLRGYPVPWFCAEVNGQFDFRVTAQGRFEEAIRYRRCWVCGQPLGAYLAFVIGPMCAVNRTTGEPPCHSECAHWSARACPFLNQTEQRRRTNDLPALAPAPGEMLERQPGVALVWTTKAFRLFDDGRGGVLIELGEPIETAWYTRGRRATHAEVMASIDSGLPALRALAEEEGPAACAALDDHLAVALRYVPQAE